MVVSRTGALLILVSSVVATTIASAEIYKWVDDNGLVHYGDCPPPECKYKEVRLPPDPSQESMRQTKERMQTLKNSIHKTRTEDENSVGSESLEQTKQTTITPHDHTRCFEKLESAWEGKIEDTRGEVAPLQLDKLQVIDIKAILNALKGRFKGVMEEIRCLSPTGTPPIKVYHYHIDWDAYWKEDNLFLLKQKATLVTRRANENRNRTEYGRFFRFLLDHGLLRYSSVTDSIVTRDIVTKINRPQFDVGILNVDRRNLTFYSREGGPLRRTRVISIRRKHNESTLSEFYYVQGELAELRQSSIER